jgi:hypothetical protein
MKSIKRTLSIVLIISISTILSFGQTSNDKIYQPTSISDCITYFENKFHPEVIEKYKYLENDNSLIESRHFDALSSFIWKKWLSNKTSPLSISLKKNRLLGKDDANNIVRIFINHLQNSDQSIDENLEFPALPPFSVQTKENEKFNEELVNYFLKGYDVQSLDPGKLDKALETYEGYESPIFIVLTKEEKRKSLYLKSFIPLPIPEIEGISEFIWGNNNFAIISSTESKAGFINKKGQVVIPMEYESVRIMDSKETDELKNPVLVKKNGKYGVVTSKNELLIPIKYQELSFTGNHLDKSEKKSQSKKEIILSFGESKPTWKWGLLDIKGNVTIPLVYDRYYGVRFDKNGKEFYIFEQNKKWGAVDSRNNILIPFDFINEYEVEKLDILKK